MNEVMIDTIKAFSVGGSKAAAVLYWSYRTAHEWAVLYVHTAVLYWKTSKLTTYVDDA